MDSKEHWEQVYSTKSAESVSWFQEHAEHSLRLIQGTGLDTSAAIVDVGGGASTLVDDLLAQNYSSITVLDLSAAALTTARQRLGTCAAKVMWIEGDITRVDLAPASFDLWHDRAVFHFLTDVDSRHRYVEQVIRTVRPGGHVIIATFGPDGPEKCSGLPVMRYDSNALHEQFGARFQLMDSTTEVHQTPFGTTQQFLYCYCKIS